MKLKLLHCLLWHVHQTDTLVPAVSAKLVNTQTKDNKQLSSNYFIDKHYPIIITSCCTYHHASIMGEVDLVSTVITANG